LEEKLGNPKVVINSAIIQIPKINEDKELGYRVNIIGTQNLCEIVSKNNNCRGMILISSWHTYGERDLSGNLCEDSGYRPDMVEDRARLYALSKTIQECIVRFFDEKSVDKVYGAIKIGTALGEGMPAPTAANLFIEKAISGEKLTPYKHSMNRPMLYVSIEDVCKVVREFTNLIIKNKKSTQNSIDHVMNIAYPKPITILDLANIVKDSVMANSNGKIIPEIQIIDKGIESIGTKDDKDKISMDISKVTKLLQSSEIKNPKTVIDELVKKRLN
jgi:UDP-glucose 4-epimerase